ncbi:DUF350 domain-containing protein [Flocculibacter collagenilyticus]|uniref:DUF350 domain-containing protein n=1 Tax=Flocculibacter collagenilyticus TaxID=2744479 RepID=UPI0018F340CE|nr:DUF350 domain-containing protein [Flocculibacter collagenilyticus]
MDIVLNNYLTNSSYVALFIVVMVVAKFIYHFSTPYNTFKELKNKNNTALSASIVGYLAGVTIIYVNVMKGPSLGLLEDVANIAMYTALGMVLLILSRIINDKVLLHSYCNHTHLHEKKCLATGIAQAASYIASGLIIGGALRGDGNIISAIAFYALGQVLLIVFTRIYDRFTQFDLQTELRQGNIAASISLSATLIAVGIVLYHAMLGSFVSWQTSLSLFMLDAVIALVLFPILRLLIDKLLLPTVSIDDAIQRDHNSSLALFEGAIAITVATVILFAL